MGFSNMMMAAAKSMPKSTMTQSMPSRTYSSCSTNEHVVVEELLEFLVHKVDGDLLEAVVLEDLEAGNVEHSAEVGLLHGGVN